MEVRSSEIYKLLSSNRNYAVIFASECNKTNSLKHEIKCKYGITELILNWKNNNSKEIAEKAFIIFDISYDDAMKYSQELLQNSFIYNDNSECREICSITYISNDEKSFYPNESIRIITDFEDVDSFFQMNNSDRRVLESIFKYESPRPSYYQTHGCYRIFFKKPLVYPSEEYTNKPVYD